MKRTDGFQRRQRVRHRDGLGLLTVGLESHPVSAARVLQEPVAAVVFDETDPECSCCLYDWMDDGGGANCGCAECGPYYVAPPIPPVKLWAPALMRGAEVEA